MTLKKYLVLVFCTAYMACNNEQPQLTQIEDTTTTTTTTTDQVEELIVEEEEDLGPIDFKKIDTAYAKGKPVSETDIVDGNTQFALELYEALDKKGQNIIVSPYSISMAFGLVYGATEQYTEKQIKKTLHFPAGNVQSFHKALGALNTTIKENTKGAITIKTANKIWNAAGYGVKPEFLEMTKAFYQSTTGTYDSPKDGAEKINAWAAKKTKNKIQEVVKKADLEDSRFALANAIYFYGNWHTMFDEEQTRENDFFLNPEKSVKADFMSEKVEGVYISDTDNKCEVVELFYKGKTASMLIVLPNEDVSLEEFVKTLGKKQYEQWTNTDAEHVDVYNGEFSVSMPKFKIEAPTINLKKVFKEKLGMKGPFEKANFNKMTRLQDLKIGGVFHKAMIEVNEQGTEAAAVTVVTMEGRGIATGPRFVANRPFLYFIKDNATHSILFMGQVVDPSK